MQLLLLQSYRVRLSFADLEDVLTLQTKLYRCAHIFLGKCLPPVTSRRNPLLRYILENLWSVMWGMVLVFVRYWYWKMSSRGHSLRTETLDFSSMVLGLVCLFSSFVTSRGRQKQYFYTSLQLLGVFVVTILFQCCRTAYGICYRMMRFLWEFMGSPLWVFCGILTGHYENTIFQFRGTAYEISDGSMRFWWDFTTPPYFKFAGLLMGFLLTAIFGTDRWFFFFSSNLSRWVGKKIRDAEQDKSLNFQ